MLSRNPTTPTSQGPSVEDVTETPAPAPEAKPEPTPSAQPKVAPAPEAKQDASFKKTLEGGQEAWETGFETLEKDTSGTVSMVPTKPTPGPEPSAPAHQSARPDRSKGKRRTSFMDKLEGGQEAWETGFETLEKDTSGTGSMVVATGPVRCPLVQLLAGVNLFLSFVFPNVVPKF